VRRKARGRRRRTCHRGCPSSGWHLARYSGVIFAARATRPAAGDYWMISRHVITPSKNLRELLSRRRARVRREMPERSRDETRPATLPRSRCKRAVRLSSRLFPRNSSSIFVSLILEIILADRSSQRRNLGRMKMRETSPSFFRDRYFGESLAMECFLIKANRLNADRVNAPSIH